MAQKELSYFGMNFEVRSPSLWERFKLLFYPMKWVSDNGNQIGFKQMGGKIYLLKERFKQIEKTGKGQ